MVKLSDYIANRLKEHYNVEHFFLVTGGGAMHLNDSLGRSIPYTCNHNEQACAFAAEGYARVNQKLAVVNVTTGPGGLNCLNGLFGQWTDSVPVLYISGQVKTRTMAGTFPEIPLRQLGDQEVDIISVVKPLTKYAVTITNPNEIKYHLDRAIYEATTGRFGPVWLNIPIDVQSAVIDEADLIDYCAPEQKKYEFSVEEIVEKIKSAKRPLIVAGHGIRLSNQIETFKNIVNTLKIPFVTTLNGFDVISTNNPYYIGRIGSIGQRAGNFALQNADLVLCLGTRNNIRQVSYNWENFAKSAYKIIVDIDKAELDKPLVVPDLKVNSDLSVFLPELYENIKSFEPNFSDWYNFCRGLKEKYSFENHPEVPQKGEMIEPYYFTHILSKFLSESDIVVLANASPTICSFQNMLIKEGQRVITNSGNASMGFALPASIGAFYQAKNRNVICIEGDGSIMMNLQELQTVVHNKLPLKIFIMNNSGYSSIKQSQKNFFGGHLVGSDCNSGVSVPDFQKIATAFGIKVKEITSSKTLEKDLKEVLESSECILCEIKTDINYSFLPKLSAKCLPDGSMISPSLEDMYPFLDRDE